MQNETKKEDISIQILRYPLVLYSSFIPYLFFLKSSFRQIVLLLMSGCAQKPMNVI